jgi:hypothetical protein
VSKRPICGFTKVMGFAILWGVAGNLAGIGWGWYRRDISAGSMVAIMGGSIGGMLIIAVAFATWILMGFPVS